MALSIGELTAIGIGLGNIAAWSKLIYDARQKKGGNGGGNGHPPSLVREHEGRMAKAEADIANVERQFIEFRKENREDHQRIFDEIGTLKAV